MPAQELPISHATHLVPYVRFLDAIGAPVERALEQTHLPGGLLHTPNCYVPTESLFAFVGKSSRREGIDDLGFRVAHAEGLGLLGPTLAGKVCESPTLLQALETFCRLVNKEASQFWTWLDVDEDEARVYIHRTFEPGVLGYTQTEWIGVMAVTTVVQLFAGPNWQPDSISLGTRNGVPRGARERFGNTRFVTHVPRVRIAFPRSVLRFRPHRKLSESRFDRPGALPSTYGSEQAEETFAGRMMQCLEPHFVDGYPPVTLGAEIAGVSVRTLQRRLAARGLSYSEVVDRARFDVASRMLLDTNEPVIQVAHATAYSDPSHFARAFRRLTGVSPSEYRVLAGRRGTE